MKEFFERHPHVCGLMVSLVMGFVMGLWTEIDEVIAYAGPGETEFSLMEVLVFMLFGSAFVATPVLLLQANVIALFQIPKETKWKRTFLIWERLSVVLGTFYLMLILGISNVCYMADWSETLYNAQLHTPIWTEAYPTFFTLVVVAVCGYLVLSCVRLNKLPPLVIVLSMSAMYMGILVCIVFGIQITYVASSGIDYDRLFIIMGLANYIIVALKTIRYKVAEWNEGEVMQYEDTARDGKKWLTWMNKKLNHSANWPAAALILMLPLLGILIAILVLFGQEPDAIIKAWTETSDWRFSQQIAPPNVQVDEHYLCTVAAGGHEKVVKPLRMGERHGHRVVVNRQLCIANAFEQILEEKTPRLHRRVRHFYDTYGFPVAKLIRTRLAADVVYILMKPLEWLFLLIIYLCDVKPENRIAMQYLPKRNR